MKTRLIWLHCSQFPDHPLLFRALKITPLPLTLSKVRHIPIVHSRTLPMYQHGYIYKTMLLNFLKSYKVIWTVSMDIIYYRTCRGNLKDTYRTEIIHSPKWKYQMAREIRIFKGNKAGSESAGFGNQWWIGIMFLRGQGRQELKTGKYWMKECNTLHSCKRL